MKALHILGISSLLGISSGSLLATPNKTCVHGDGTASNISILVDGKAVSSLKGNVGMGSTVSIAFRNNGSETTNFSLVSYTTEESDFTYDGAIKNKVYDYQTIDVAPGAVKTVKVNVPYTFFEVDFVKGCVMTSFGPANSPHYYDRESRLIDQAAGGNHSPEHNICGGPGNLDTCKKVTICHIPPGNPDNAHTITISRNAVDKHFEKHGDYYGPCKKTPPPPTGECACDYDKNGLNDLLYGSTFTSTDNSVTVHFSAHSDTVQISSTFMMDSIVYVTSAFDTITVNNVNSPTKTLTASVSIVSVIVDGNIIQNEAFFDPQFLCQDCQGGGFFPVTMTSFTGKKIADNVVELKWSTSSEINNAYFVIEKSSDITNWEEVQGCKVAGHGTTQIPQSYSCTDDHAGMGQNIVYYRPKQVDNNGTYEYFNTIKIRLMDAAFPTAVDNVYPNPATDAVHIRYTADDNGIFNINILSIDGKSLLHSSYAAQRGSQVIDLNLPETALKSGFYILEVQNDAQVYRQKIYKQ